jgi:hypothetical protein
MGHLLQLKCAHSPLNQRILSSTSVPFTLTTLQVPNLALTHTKRFTVWGRKRRKLSCVFDLFIFFINYMFRILASFLVIRPSTNHIDLSFIKRKAFVLPSLHDMCGAQLTADKRCLRLRERRRKRCPSCGPLLNKFAAPCAKLPGLDFFPTIKTNSMYSTFLTGSRTVHAQFYKYNSFSA